MTSVCYLSLNTKSYINIEIFSSLVRIIIFIHGHGHGARDSQKVEAILQTVVVPINTTVCGAQKLFVCVLLNEHKLLSIHCAQVLMCIQELY